MNDLYGPLDEKRKKRKKAGTESSKESSLKDWFGRKGAKGKKKGWVDCNAPDGKGGYKACGRGSGEKRKKYPACRPTPGACKERGKGKSWGKKSKSKKKNEELYKMDLYRMIEEEIEVVVSETSIKKHEKELEKISGELRGASKMHKGQADRIDKILDQTDDEDLKEGEGMNCGCGNDPCETYGKNNEKIIVMVKEELEAVLGEAVYEPGRAVVDIDTGEERMNPEDLMRDEVQDLADKFEVEASVEIDLDGKPAIMVYHQNGETTVHNDTEEMYQDLASRQEMSESTLDEEEEEGKKDACYHKVKSRYEVWPSAYASGALVKCRDVGADNWGNSKKESLQMMIEDELAQVLDEKKHKFSEGKKLPPHWLAQGLEADPLCDEKVPDGASMREYKKCLESPAAYQRPPRRSLEEKAKKPCKPSKGKRFAKRVDGKCRSFGQKGQAKGGGDRIRPGTKKGDAYCARSAKIKKCKNPPCANALSRKKWKCRGSKSMKEAVRKINAK
jgi:hypothetical protein